MFGMFSISLMELIVLGIIILGVMLFLLTRSNKDGD